MAHLDHSTAFRPEEIEVADDSAVSSELRMNVTALIQTPSKSRDLRIRERAYLLWEGAGRPNGSQDEHWQQALREIDVEFPLD